jgi:hypothetical protein
MFLSNNSEIVAHGQLKLFVKETGRELFKKNLVIKNSPHVTALSLGGDINTTTIKISSWGDNFIETPTGSYYNMSTLESLEGIHAIDGNHTIKTFDITGHSYPASKSIKFNFQFDRNSAVELIGKNLVEFGLYFNDILYSRVALLEDNYFESWMTVVGEWTIIFMSCSGGYSNYILNQYEISSLWTMDAVDVNYQIEDYAGRNNLAGVLSPAKLISNLVGIDSNVVESDFIHRDSLCTFFEDSGEPNLARIENTNIYNQSLDLQYKFSIWQWFKFKAIDISPFILNRGEKWVLLSKWCADFTLNQCSYRLYLERSSLSETVDEVFLKFDINDNGSIVTAASAPLNLNQLETINLFNTWCLAFVTLDPITQKLTLYLNGEEVGSEILTGNGITPQNQTSFLIGGQQDEAYDDLSIDTNSVFKGFVDETGISDDIFNPASISLLWNNGFGDFYNP